MSRSLFLIFTLWLATAASLQAGFSLNPLKWFTAEEEALKSYDASSDDREAEATELLELGKGEFENKNLSKASKIFKRIAKNYPSTKAASEALYLSGRVMMNQGQWTNAFELLQQIIDKHPNYPNFDQVIGAQFECATALMKGSPGKRFGIISTFKKYNKSITFFETIVQKAPYSDYAPLSLMNVAIVAQKMKNSEVAIDALDRIINDYPQSNLKADAYYNLAKTYASLTQSHQYDQGSTRQGISYYEDFLALFPDSEYVSEVEANLDELENTLAKSRFEIGNFFYFHRNNNTAAIVFYNEAITIAPESISAAEAKERLADIEAGVPPPKKSSILRSLLFAN